MFFRELVCQGLLSWSLFGLKEVQTEWGNRLVEKGGSIGLENWGGGPC